MRCISVYASASVCVCALFVASYLSYGILHLSLSLTLSVDVFASVLSFARYATDYKVIIVVIAIFIIEINADKPNFRT